MGKASLRLGSFRQNLFSAGYAMHRVILLVLQFRTTLSCCVSSSLWKHRICSDPYS